MAAVAGPLAHQPLDEGLAPPPPPPPPTPMVAPTPHGPQGEQQQLQQLDAPVAMVAHLPGAADSAASSPMGSSTPRDGLRQGRLDWIEAPDGLRCTGGGGGTAREVRPLSPSPTASPARPDHRFVHGQGELGSMVPYGPPDTVAMAAAAVAAAASGQLDCGGSAASRAAMAPAASGQQPCWAGGDAAQHGWQQQQQLQWQQQQMQQQQMQLQMRLQLQQQAAHQPSQPPPPQQRQQAGALGDGAQTGHASPAGGMGVEQKLSALSKRTAAEFRKAEKERGIHGKRLEFLEELFQREFGGLEARLEKLRQEAAAEAERSAHRQRERIELELGKGSEDALGSLRKSCSELGGRLEDLKREVVQQRLVADQLRSDLEEQMAGLGGALAQKMRQRLSSLKQEVLEDSAFREADRSRSVGVSEEQLALLRQDGCEMREQLARLQAECDRVAEVAMGEARVVHLEVMSVNTRLSAVEERLASDTGKRRQSASPQPRRGNHPPAAAIPQPYGNSGDEACEGEVVDSELAAAADAVASSGVRRLQHRAVDTAAPPAATDSCAQFGGGAAAGDSLPPGHLDSVRAILAGGERSLLNHYRERRKAGAVEGTVAEKAGFGGSVASFGGAGGVHAALGGFFTSAG